MRISVLALDDTFDTGLSIILDTFSFANLLGKSMGKNAPRFDVRLVGMRRRIKTHCGFRIDVEPLDGPQRPNYVVVPALFAASPAELIGMLERRDIKDAGQALPVHGRITLAAACTSTFVLAEAGLLDQQRATTTWWLAPAFRVRFPAVELDESRMVIDAPGRVTAGAAMAHVDLALWIVRQASPALASMVARYLVVEARPSQAPFIIPDHLAHADEVVERFERWVREHLDRPFSLEDAARAVKVSPRSLERRVRTVMGKPPVAFVQDIRVEVATHLLRSTGADVEAVAAKVGYRDGTTLRTLLRKKLGRGIKELRRAL